jgi:hypothetical protein
MLPYGVPMEKLYAAAPRENAAFRTNPGAGEGI